MPQRTFIAGESKTFPGFKVSKNKLTQLLCRNEAKDCNLKPLLLNYSEKARALKKRWKNIVGFKLKV